MTITSTGGFDRSTVIIVRDSTPTPAYRRKHRGAANFSNGVQHVLVVRGNWRKAKLALKRWDHSKRGVIVASMVIQPAAAVTGNFPQQ